LSGKQKDNIQAGPFEPGLRRLYGSTRCSASSLHTLKYAFSIGSNNEGVLAAIAYFRLKMDNGVANVSLSSTARLIDPTVLL